jgi:hypothetical protein
MKPINLCLIVLFSGLAGCKESQYSTNVIQQPNKVELEIYTSFWFTRTKKLTHAMVGGVYMAIKGRTNAERLTVRTYGDGKIGDLPIKPDNGGVFNDTIQICFTYFSTIPELPLSIDPRETVLKAYLGSEMIVKYFSSGPLQYDE